MIKKTNDDNSKKEKESKSKNVEKVIQHKDNQKINKEKVKKIET